MKAMPTSEVITFIAVQLRRVCGTVMPKYSFTTQKPESLTWDKMVPPAHSASTIISGE